MMMEALVTFKTAKLAKNKGFILDNDENSLTVYENNDKISLKSISKKYYKNYKELYFENIALQRYFSFPTQSLLQTWLRDVHNIHIEVLLTEASPYKQFYFRIMKIGEYFTLSHDGIYKDTYEEVLEVGLQKALNLIV